jgi:hypothetical protein
LNFDCKKKDDGLYADPDNGCARYFIQCSAGRLHKMPCGSTLVFDGTTCVYPKNVPACNNKPTRRGVNSELTAATSLPDDTVTVKRPVVDVDLAVADRKRRDVGANETILNGSATVAGNETSFNQSAVSDETILMNSTTASGSVTTIHAQVNETTAAGSINETETGAGATVTSTSATVNHHDTNEPTSTAASNGPNIIHPTFSASNETATTAASSFNESTIKAGNETATTAAASFNDSIVTAASNETSLAHPTVSGINETATTHPHGSTVTAIGNETSLNHSTIAGADETATTVGHNETTHTSFSSFNETATATAASSSSFSSSILTSEAASTLGTTHTEDATTPGKIYPARMSSSHVTNEPITETYPKLTRRTYKKQTRRTYQSQTRTTLKKT